MAQTPTNIPVTTETKGLVPAGQAPWYPLATLREEMDRLFDDFFGGSAMMPFRRRVDTDPWRRFQGMFEGDLPNGRRGRGGKGLPHLGRAAGHEREGHRDLARGRRADAQGREEGGARGEGQEPLRLRAALRGSFQRSFALPEDADPEKIEAAFRNGVLTVTLPKRPEAQAKQRKIEVKAG